MLIRRLLVLALPSLLFAVSLPAQDKDAPRADPKVDNPDEELERQKLERLEQLKRDEAEAGKEAGDELKAAERPPEKLPGLERFVSTVAAVKPYRIGPGGSGTLHLILAMVDTAVLQVGGQLEILYPGQLGPLTFGPWTMDPAAPGTLPTAFRGQPVYDNTAIVRIPVQVGASAEYGDYAVGISVTAEVTDGETGQVRGKFFGSARATITVGEPLPTPVAAVRQGQDDAVGTEPVAAATQWQPGDAVRASGADAPPVGAGPIARVPTAEPASGPQSTADSGPGVLPTVEDQPPSVSWIWIVGGLLVAGLGALGVAAARRR